jgi:hypothetical protein
MDMRILMVFFVYFSVPGGLEMNLKRKGFLFILQICPLLVYGMF